MSRRMKTAAQLLATIILATQSLTSCSDYDNGFDEATIRYNQNFRERFGPIDPNQDWNLVRQLAEKNGGGNTSMATRADHGYGDVIDNENDPKRNEWPNENYSELTIPGYPDKYGAYHVGEYGDKIQYSNDKNTIHGLNPIGDVTDEEIVYVSQWFRTHYKPKSLKAHWRNFFLQDISHDADREVTERDAEGVPVSCDGGALKLTSPIIYANGMESSEVATSKFAMNQLWAKTEAQGNWKHLYNFNFDSGNQFQKLAKAPRFENYDLKNIEYQENENENTYVYVDNNSYSYTSPYYVYQEGQKPASNAPWQRTIMLYVGAGTEDFSYHSNYDDSRYKRYVLVHLKFTIHPTGYCNMHPDRDCKTLGHEYDGYYLGFDYQAYKETYDGNGNVEKYVNFPRDGFYSNWILKVTYTRYDGDPEEYEEPEPDDDHYKDEDEDDPTPPNAIKEQGLIVCEDLGDYDFDFNDIVLKLQHIKTDTETDKLRITAMAAGGTLPSYIYYKDELVQVDKTYSEIHALLDKKTLTPTNVGEQFTGEGKSWTVEVSPEDLENVQKKAEQIPEYPGYGVASYVFDEGLLSIQVNDQKGTRLIKSGYKSHIDNGHNEAEGDYTEEGDAPQMMFLPVNFLWPRERVHIEAAYSGFPDWVGDSDATGWYSYENANPERVTKRDISINDETDSEEKTPLKWTDTDSDTKSIEINSPEGEFITVSYEGFIGECTDYNKYLEVEFDNTTHQLTVTSTGLSVNNDETITMKIIDQNNTSNIIYLRVTINKVDANLVWEDGTTAVKNICIEKDCSISLNYRYNGSGTTTLTCTPAGYVDVQQKDNNNVVITGNKQTEENVKIRITGTGEGDNRLRANVTVIENANDYSLLYGKKVSSSTLTDYTNTDYLIDVQSESFPTSGNVTITFIYEANDALGVNNNEPIGGISWETDNYYERWDLKTTYLNISSKYVIAKTKYSAIIIEGKAEDIRNAYSYLTCLQYNYPCQGAYIKTTSSAKKRTIRRK